MGLLFPLLCSALAADSVIVDDEDGSPEFTTTTENWTTWSSNGEGYSSSDAEYHYLSQYVGDGSREGTATWTPTLPAAGTYRVETWFRRTSNRTDDADHYVYDGYGNSTHVVIDQSGEGPSGWVSLGEYWCNSGAGGCYVTLDGDDGESDEANAMQFTLVSETEPEPETEDGCTGDPVPGTHTITFYASGISASSSSDDWEDEGEAKGEPDGGEAHTPNVDSGEYLRVSGWEVCDPPGEETINKVEIGVLSRLQYDSGQYALEMRLDGGGSAATTYSHTSATWTTLDVTGDRGSWVIGDLDAVAAEVSLHDHPGGARDSDAWVDAFQMTVTYTTADTSGGGTDTAPSDGGGGVDTNTGGSGDGGGGVDTSPGGGDTSPAPDTGGGGGPGGPWPGGGDDGGSGEVYDDNRQHLEGGSCACGAVPGPTGWAALALLAPLFVRRRR